MSNSNEAHISERISDDFCHHLIYSEKPIESFFGAPDESLRRLREAGDQLGLVLPDSDQDLLDKDDAFGLKYGSDKYEELFEAIVSLTDPNHLQLTFELVTALRNGKFAKIEITDQESPDEIDWAKAPQVPLPSEAPEKYISHAKSGDIVDFLNRVYGPTGPNHPTRPNHPGWLDGISMGRKELGNLDMKAKRRLDNIEFSSKKKIALDQLNIPPQVTVRDRRTPYDERVIKTYERKKRLNSILNAK